MAYFITTTPRESEYSTINIVAFHFIFPNELVRLVLCILRRSLVFEDDDDDDDERWRQWCWRQWTRQIFSSNRSSRNKCFRIRHHSTRTHNFTAPGPPIQCVVGLYWACSAPVTLSTIYTWLKATFACVSRSELTECDCDSIETSERCVSSSGADRPNRSFSRCAALYHFNV